MIPKHFTLEENNFNRAWYKIINYILNNGIELNLGSRDKHFPILDTSATIILKDNAINQILNKEIHSDCPFKSNAIKEYCKTLTSEYLEELEKLDSNKQFTYTYIGRLIEYPTTFSLDKGIKELAIDQLSQMRIIMYHQAKENFTSNRCQAITWIPFIDEDIKSAPCKVNPKDSPCLQRIQLRHLGNGNVDIHLHYRSHDAYKAWEANLIAVINMLKNYVLDSSRYKIVQIIEFNDSLHVYKSDVNEAKQVKSIPNYI